MGDCAAKNTAGGGGGVAARGAVSACGICADVDLMNRELCVGWGIGHENII